MCWLLQGCGTQMAITVSISGIRSLLIRTQFPYQCSIMGSRECDPHYFKTFSNLNAKYAVILLH
jgi:hypothetical protein